MKLTVGTKPVFATAIVCIRCGRRETHPLDRQNRNVALMVRELEDEVETLKAELNETQRHREGNQVCYVSEMCELERVRAERDAAVRDLASAALCENCKRADSDECGETCGDSTSAYRWEWRGPEPKEGNNAAT